MIQEKARGRGKAREKVASRLRKNSQFFKKIKLGKGNSNPRINRNIKTRSFLSGLNLEGKVIPFPCKSIERRVWDPFGQTHWVITSPCKPANQVRSAPPLKAGFTKSSDRLHPPKAFFYFLPKPLTYFIRRMPGGTLIYCRPLPTGFVGEDGEQGRMKNVNDQPGFGRISNYSWFRETLLEP